MAFKFEILTGVDIQGDPVRALSEIHQSLGEVIDQIPYDECIYLLPESEYLLLKEAQHDLDKREQGL